MIVHTITAYQPIKLNKAQHEQRFKGELGSDKHKEDILARACRLTEGKKIEEGCFVIYKRNTWQVLCVYNVLSEGLDWDGLKPLNIELFHNTLGMEWVHHSDIKRTR